MRDHGEVRDVFVRGPKPSYDSPDIPKSRHVAPQSVHAISSAASLIKKREHAIKLEGTATKRSNTTFKKQATTTKLDDTFMKKLSRMSA